jgi:DNA-binding beta-propeller fold protein YncE
MCSVDEIRLLFASRGNSRGRRFRLAVGCVAAIATIGAGVSPAAAKDRIYWDNYLTDSIYYSNLDGSGGGILPTGSATVYGPMGNTIDPAAGRLYFVNYGNNPAATGSTIGYANLDGSGGGDVNTGGVPVTAPHGIAVNHATNTIYWTNDNNNTIAFAKLDGSGGGFLNTGSATVSDPRGLAIDPAGGKIYWANHFGQMISFANLDGSGGGDIPTGQATVLEPEGVALDGAGRIFWGFADSGSDKISYAFLDGSGGADLPVAGANPNYPHGVAIDPRAGRIYWTNFDSNEISFAALNGSGGGILTTPGVVKDGPSMPVLLEAPTSNGKPDVKGNPNPGSQLTCKAGWKGDQLASQLFQAPESTSFTWLRNGKPVPGEHDGTLKSKDVAEYSCVASAQNAAGSTSKASDAIGVFKVGKLRRNLEKGTARLTVKVPGPGKLSLRGHRVVKERAFGFVRSHRANLRKVKGGRARLLIKPKGKAKRRLERTGRAKVKLRIGYKPPDGDKGVQTRVFRLKER